MVWSPHPTPSAIGVKIEFPCCVYYFGTQPFNTFRIYSAPPPSTYKLLVVTNVKFIISLRWGEGGQNRSYFSSLLTSRTSVNFLWSIRWKRKRQRLVSMRCTAWDKTSPTHTDSAEESLISSMPHSSHAMSLLWSSTWRWENRWPC